jgi:hypothetical protein
MNPQILRQLNIEELARMWRSAEPFPHVVLDNFLSDPFSIKQQFPDLNWPGWTPLGDSYQRNKFSCSDISLFPNQIAHIIRSLNEPDFLGNLEEITGIRGLIPDPYLEGGGLHLSAGGGILALHTDFHIYGRLNLYRRLNLIVYFNERWSVGDGGELELSLPDSTRPAALVEPLMNRAVLFGTNDVSVHGFTNAVREGTLRCSIALYYYTSTETQFFSGDQTTHWRTHGHISTLNRPRFWIYKLLLRFSRAFSIAAQSVNPNQGISLIRTRLRNKNR